MWIVVSIPAAVVGDLAVFLRTTLEYVVITPFNTRIEAVKHLCDTIKSFVEIEKSKHDFKGNIEAVYASLRRIIKGENIQIVYAGTFWELRELTAK